jgi:GntR family transcriptional regulator, transcriptional repressor for pyruvate dehydrogenase complex
MTTQASRGTEARFVAPKVPVQKVAEFVAADVRSRIVTGELTDGDELPRESEMVEEYGVSRPSLREALRILETERLVRIRRGKRGGCVVRRPTAASAAYHLGLTLTAENVTLEDLAKARLSLEPACAALAAQLPERELIVDELTQLIDASEAAKTTDQSDNAMQEFHLRLVELCGNKTMTVLVGALEAVWSGQETRVLRTEDLQEDPKARHRAILAHRRVVSAIARGDTERAIRETRKHLADMQHLMPGPLGATVVDFAANPSTRTTRASLITP